MMPATETHSNSPAIPGLEQLPDIAGKRVILRTDLNVPMAHGKIIDHTRIHKIIPSVEALAKRGAKVIILSHFGRPKGAFSPDLTLAPIADALSNAMQKEIKFAVDCIGTRAEKSVENLQSGDIILMENLRFHEGEAKNEENFVNALAAHGDYFVNDAFSCSHRSHASIVGLASKLPSVAGHLLLNEIQSLESLLLTPEKPLVAIVGGSKVSTKIGLLHSLVKQCDSLIIGGGMANTFLKAKGKPIAQSLHEEALQEEANNIMALAIDNQCSLLLPEDVVVADDLMQPTYTRVIMPNDIKDHEKILDIGPQTIEHAVHMLKTAQTVIWNGPLGAFEFPPFDIGTSSIARTLAFLSSQGTLKSVAGGGDVLAAIGKSKLTDSFSYISTAGGAFLEWLEGKELPGLTALRQSSLA